jgi:outer membrane protein assembly factor BamB
MEKSLKRLFYPLVLSLQSRRHFCTAGNVLIYVVVLMLIFGVLGVVMVSLFTSTTASTVTRNDTRRARYLSESGVRYATSELRIADFEEDIIIDPLNMLTYTVTGAGSFDLNIFSAWFESDADVDAPDVVNASPPLGEIPVDFTTDPANPLSDVWLVNYEYITGTGPDIVTMRDEAYSYAISGTSLAVDIAGSSFLAEAGERVVLAVEPIGLDQNIAEGGDLVVARDARFFFPAFNGAININRVDYAYERLVDDEANNRVILENVTASQFPNTLPTFPSPILSRGTGGSPYDGDFVVLSPRNYMVIAEGTSDQVSYGNNYLQGMNAYDHSLIRPGSLKPDITAEDLVSNLSEQETDTRFFETNLIDYELEIGGGTTEEFGSAFFDASMNIGGERDYCQQGACQFALGVRVFFLLNFTQQGDGITFTLTSFGPELAPHNSASSVGGDIELSELMGYAGDSRIVPNADPLNDLDFLATNPNDRGLDPPKIAVEFDTRTNNRIDDPPPDYCVGADAESNLRNDPLAGNEDAVQYVFWGRTSFLNIPCRDNNTLYDDNRHDADGEDATEEWRFGTGGPVSLGRSAIGPDGTIYMSALDATLYALNEDGSTKWTYSLGVPPGGNNDYMPGVDPVSGTVYSDITGNSIVAINPDGTFKWDFYVDADIDSTPVVGPDRTVYFGTDVTGSAEFFLYALNPVSRDAGLAFPQPGEWQFPVGDEVDNVPALSPDGATVYFVSNDNNLYALKRAAREADPTGVGGINAPLGEWTFPILAESGEVNSSPTVNPSDGTIYVGSDDHNVYAVNPDGTEKWRFTTGADVESSPVVAIDPIDGQATVYIGSDDDRLYAINADTGAGKWSFNTGANVISSPIVDVDGTIYVGSDNGNLYAINPNGTPKWVFSTGAAVRSSPAIGDDGFIHIGSDNTNFYTVSQFADPRNFKDEDKSAGKLLTLEDLDSSVDASSNTDWLNGSGIRGPWAVRLQVDRSLVGVPNALGDLEYDYTIRLWMRQCNNDITCDNIMGTWFQDTRIDYDYTAVVDLPMIQRIKLSQAEHDAFDRFFFGFTGAAGAEALDVTIGNFQLSFIRPGDPLVECDRNNWPLEDSPPLPDCIPQL